MNNNELGELNCNNPSSYAFLILEISGHLYLEMAVAKSVYCSLFDTETKALRHPVV